MIRVQKFIGKNFKWLVIVILVILLFRKCNQVDRIKNKNNLPEIDTTSVTVDTFYIENPPKIIKEDSLIYIEDTLSYEINKSLRDSIKKLNNEKERLNYLLSLLTVKEYDTTYYSDINHFRIKEKVRGTILDREVEISNNSKEVIKTITTEKKVKPSLLFNGGVTSGLKTDFNTLSEQPYLGLELGIRTKNGLYIDLQYNTLKQIELGLKKDIFVLY